MTQKVSISGSSGYINIPIHVLYKTEYINSVVEERGKKPKHFGTCIKKCKQSINYTVNKFKNYVNSLTRGFYQEFILNNVDAKTKNNLLSYIKSLNLEIKECLAEDDGTKVIKVDIGPIKNKPEIMNDLLVYIENEKLKIARRNDILSKSQGDKNYANNPEEYDEEASSSLNVEDRQSISDLSDKNLDPEEDKKISTKKKVKIKKKITAESAKSNEIIYRTQYREVDFVAGNSSNCSKSIHFPSKYNIIIEDPHSIAEKRAKDYKDIITSISAPSIDNKKLKVDNVFMGDELRTVDTKHDSTIICSCSSLLSKDGLTDIEISSQAYQSIDVKEKTPNKITTGVGIFWNAGSMIFNDQKVCMIERADRVKEESINVISILANRAKNKQGETSLSALKSETNSTMYKHILESGNTLDTSLSNVNSQENDLYKHKSHEKSVDKVKTDYKVINNNQEKNKDELNDNKLSLKKMKDEEVYMSNGVMSDPFFKLSMRPLKSYNDHGDILSHSNNYEDDEKGSKPKKKIKFFRFWKKFTKKKKKYSEKVISVKPVQIINISKEETELTYSKNSNRKIVDDYPHHHIDIVENMKSLNGEIINKKYFFKENNKLKINLEDSKIANPSLLDLKELESFQLSSLNSFILNATKTSDKKKYKNVVDKLYKRLKGMKRVQELSDSEISSGCESWPQENGIKYHGEFSSSSIYSYPSRTSSVDTINSVTRIAIKKLAKPFPSMNTK